MVQGFGFFIFFSLSFGSFLLFNHLLFNMITHKPLTEASCIYTEADVGGVVRADSLISKSISPH